MTDTRARRGSGGIVMDGNEARTAGSGAGESERLTATEPQLAGDGTASRLWHSLYRRATL